MKLTLELTFILVFTLSISSLITYTHHISTSGNMQAGKLAQVITNVASKFHD